MIRFPCSRMIVITMLLLAAGVMHIMSSAMASPDFESTITIMVKNDTALAAAAQNDRIGRPTIEILSPGGGSPLGTCEDFEVPIKLSVGAAAAAADGPPAAAAAAAANNILILFANNQEVSRWHVAEQPPPYKFEYDYTYIPDESDRTTFEQIAFVARTFAGTSEESDEVIVEIEITNSCVMISSEPEGKMVPGRNFLLDLNDSDSATVSLNLADGCKANDISLTANPSNSGKKTNQKVTQNSYGFDYMMEEEDGEDILEYRIESLRCGNPIDGDTR